MPITQQAVPGRQTSRPSKWMQDALDDPAHWLARADEARAIGDNMSPDARQTMEGIALGYEHLARQAERRRRLTLPA